MSNLNIPIFCINLERAKERKEKIIEEWIKNLKLDINFWKAYDRRLIDNNQFLWKYDESRAKNFLKRPLSNGEIACSTSFASLYKYLLENNYDEVIVMEDDISPNIKDKNILYDYVSNGKINYPNSDLMILFNTRPYISLMNDKQNLFFNNKKPNYGNLLLYLNRKAIKIIYEILIQFICPADHPQQILYKSKTLNIIGTYHSLCFHNTEYSYIGNDLRFKSNQRIFIP